MQSDVKQLVGQDKVVAVILQDAGAEGSVGTYLAQQKIPVIGAEGYSPALWGALPTFFTNFTTSTARITSYVSAASATGAKSIAVAYCAEAPSCAQAGTIVAAEAPKQGMTYTGAVKISASAPDYTAECLDFIQEKAQTIAVAIDAATGARMVSGCLQQRYAGSFDVNVGSVSKAGFDVAPKGTKFVGAIGTFPWWSNAAPVQQFRSVMAQYAPGVDVRQTFPESVWVSLELFKKAVSGNANNLTPAKVLTEYYSLKNETLDGLLPQPITYTEGKPAPSINCSWLYSYTVGGQFATLHSGQSGNGQTGDLVTSCVTG